jgi:NAD(P)-dependent dehydrogenase (short-subunit alcohol dehydrogenase family)
MSNLFDISGKAAIVTGAASGLGLSIAGAMAEHGARIALFDLNQKGLEEAEYRLRKTGADLLIKTVDVGDRNQMRRSIGAVADDPRREEFLHLGKRSQGTRSLTQSSKKPIVRLTGSLWFF